MTGFVGEQHGATRVGSSRGLRVVAWVVLLAGVVATTGAAMEGTQGLSQSRAGALFGALGAVVAAVAAWWMERDGRPRAAAGLLAAVTTCWGPLLAVGLPVASWLEVALLSVWSLTPVALLLLATSWGADTRRVVALAIAPAVLAVLCAVVLYRPLDDPRCGWRCGVGVAPVDADADVVVAVVTALTVASAAVAGRWLVVHHAAVPGAVVAGLGVALATVPVLGLVRVTSWGLTAGTPARSWGLTLPVVTAAVGVLWHAWATHRVRRRVRLLAARLGGLEGGGDEPDGEVVHYALPGGHGWVDADGRAVDLDPQAAPTVEVRDDSGMPWVRLVAPRARGRAAGRRHSEDASRWDAARWLVLENAHAAALSRADRRELEASRRSIVAASDAERSRIERDLHDGVQQRLVSAKLHLALGRRQAPATAGPALLEAEGRAQAALEALRDVAHGLFPRILDTEGLLPALEELAGARGVRVTCPEPLPDLPAQVRTAAYALVRRLTEPGDPPVGGARVLVTVVGEALSVRVVVPGRGRADAAAALLELEDRVGALGGDLRADEDLDALVVQAVLPCGS